ncbi:hypothetical protein OG875_17970 [Streptomyces sp. NBC_01498]|uniref:hypothetical protein n=1 Tax=Streptomyces sp. NBC_01498 TaxID=2975870 RepID=UPI002E7C2F81|nr:hypothetical protein [Streptomyces sp. NBC_01498]WTL26307.1 hypothetical protein OG875_17970 [Streptomyces sp. NBC_01498]
MSTDTKSSVELIELGKFFTVAARRLDAGFTAPEMFSAAIDAAWHQLATSPQAHSAFASEHAGRRLTHVEAPGNGPIAWAPAYEEMYGAFPDIWFTNADGTLNEQSLSLYRATGSVTAEWNCSPAPGDGEDMAPNTTTR